MPSITGPNTKRWVARRKAAVVAAVSSGKLTLKEASRRYQLSEEEFSAWQRAFETSGIHGLHATCVQQYGGAHFSRPARRASRTATPIQHGFDPGRGRGVGFIPVSFLPARI
jgi:transposase-like protein